MNDFHAGGVPGSGSYRPGHAEYWLCRSHFFQGSLTDDGWRQGYEIALRHRNVLDQYALLALRCEWLLTCDQGGQALDAIDKALKITNRIGAPRTDYHDLRAWALGRLGRADEARAELADGEQRLFAAEAWLCLGNLEQARTCVLDAYRWAWGEGPPYIRCYYVERGRALLKQLGEPEPQLPPFDPSKVKPIPFEKEIRAAIAEFKAKEEAESDDDDES